MVLALMIFLLIADICAICVVDVYMTGKAIYEMKSSNTSCYDTCFTRSSVRVMEGLITSNSMLENMREKLSKKNSKF